MKATYLLIGLSALILLISGAMAYSGFNRVYYTNNYYPTVYQTSQAYSYGYTYPTYYATSYYPTYAYPTYYYPTYTYPTYYNSYYAPSYGSYYSNMSIYSGSNGWGISIGRGSMCGYYGYC